MLSIKVIKVGSEDYYLDLAAEDYYLNGGEPPGKWMGRACLKLGLAGKVKRDQLKRAFQGYHPTIDGPPGKPPGRVPLVQNAGKKNRRAGVDLTLSLPKSVSVIWSQATRDQRQQIETLCEQAVRETLEFVQEAFGFARTGKAGTGEMIAADLSFAVFQHGTSRACDPQLHWHVLQLNLGYCADGQTRSLDPKPLFRNKMLLGAIFRSKVAHKLRESLGLQAIRNGNSFDIQGVPQELLDAHSTRRKQILADMEKKGRFGAKAAAQSTVETRPTKEHRSRQQLFEEWREINAEHGFDDRALQRLIQSVVIDYDKLIPKILKEALDNTKRRLSHFTAHDFMREVLYVAPTYGVPYENLRGSVEEFLQTSKELVPLPTNGPQRFAAVSALELELKMLRQLEKLQKRQGLQVSDERLIKVLGKAKHLNREQTQAVRHLLQGTAAIRIVQGYAGTGKTTMLRTAVEAWQAEGFNVVGACFTGAAAEVLQDEIGIPCDTINMTLADFNQGLVDIIKRWGKHSFKQLAREARGKKTFSYEKPKPIDINRRTIILIDEAGMVNTRHMTMLMKWANKNKATLVLTGDEAQIPAVEGGSPLMSITRRVGCTRMTDIKRQNDYWAKAAAYYLAKGEVAKALALYDERAMLKVDEQVDDALARLVRDWESHCFDRTERSRILTLTNDLAHEANQLAQQKLLDRQLLDPRSRKTIVDVSDGEGKQYESFVHVGDRVLFTKNDRTFEVNNGQTGTVLGFTVTTKKRPQQALKVRLDNGRIVKVPLAFKHMRLGYSSTVHKAQGGTFDEVYVLLAGGYQNLPLSYVQGTRSREATHFYTVRDLYDQIKELGESRLVNQMQREIDLSLAADLFPPPTAAAKTSADLIQKVLDDWRKAGHFRDSLIVTPDEEQASTFNRKCHELCYAMAQSDWEKRRHLQSEKGRTKLPTLEHNGKTLAVGTRVRFLKRGTLADGLIQHELGTVTAVSPEVETISIELDRGKDLCFAWDKLPHLELGYAVSYEQANAGSYRKEQAYLVEPQAFHLPAFQSSGIHFVANDYAATNVSMFSQPAPMNYSSTNSFQFKNPQTYMTQQHLTQMAADWHQKMYAMNQTTSHQIPSDYSHTTTQYQHVQSL